MAKKYSRKKKYKGGRSIKNYTIPNVTPKTRNSKHSSFLENIKEKLPTKTDVTDYVNSVNDYLSPVIYLPSSEDKEFEYMNEVYEKIKQFFGPEILYLFRSEIYHSIMFDTRDMTDADDSNIYFTESNLTIKELDENQISNLNDKLDETSYRINNLIEEYSKNESEEQEQEVVVNNDVSKSKTIKKKDIDDLFEEIKKKTEDIYDVNILRVLNILKTIFIKNFDNFFVKNINDKKEYNNFINTLKKKIDITDNSSQLNE